MYIVTTRQMQAAEKAADTAGLSYNQMMENAGRSIAEAIQAEFDVSGTHILILVGPGNNGGDGLVVARYLSQSGASVAIYVWKRNINDDPNWALLDDIGVDRIFSEDDEGFTLLDDQLNKSAVIIDALLGTGVSRPIGGSLAELLDLAAGVISTRRVLETPALVTPVRPEPNNEFGPAVVAVDVPSGLNSDTGAVDDYTLAADLTVTLAAVKRGHILLPGPRVVGRLLVGDIGITPNCYPNAVMPEMATPARVAQLLPARPVTAHKGTFGTAMLVAGCINYTGAAILAGTAATRSGAGLVAMAVPHSIYPIVASRIAEATYWPLPDINGHIASDAVPILQEKFDQTSALLIGPGLGNTAETTGFLHTLLTSSGDNLPSLVLDADALNILAAMPNWWQAIPPDSILTPHPGEMARLINSTVADVQQHRLDVAAEMAAKWQQIVVLKGSCTVIAAPNKRVMVMPFANAALAKGGTGDVLAGLIAGLRAQGVTPFQAAMVGAYVHGLAGELAVEQLDVASVLAGDLVSLLPLAFNQLRQS